MLEPAPHPLTGSVMSSLELEFQGWTSWTVDKDSGNIGNVMDDISSGAVRKNYGSDCVVE